MGDEVRRFRSEEVLGVLSGEVVRDVRRRRCMGVQVYSWRTRRVERGDVYAMVPCVVKQVSRKAGLDGVFEMPPILNGRKRGGSDFSGLSQKLIFVAVPRRKRLT